VSRPLERNHGLWPSWEATGTMKEIPASAWVGALGRGASTLAGLSLLVMCFIGAADVISTKLLNYPIPSAFEATETLMVLTIFMALAYTQARRQHIAVDIISSRFPPRTQQGLSLLTQLLTLAFFALIAWEGWRMSVQSWQIGEYASGLIQYPVYPAKIGLAVGATLMVLQALTDVVGESRTVFRARAGPAAPRKGRSGA